MRYQLYNQKVIDRKHAVYGDIAEVTSILSPYLVTTITNTQTAMPNMEYLDVPKTAENWGVNYVVAFENFQTPYVQGFAFFVNRKVVISQNVIRLFLTLDTISTFFGAQTSVKNGYIKRSNNSALYPTAKTLSYSEINCPRQFEVDSTQNFTDNLSSQALIVFEVTGESVYQGRVLFATTNFNSTSPQDYAQGLVNLSRVNRANLLIENNKTPTIKILHIYALTFNMLPTATRFSGVAFYLKDDSEIVFTGSCYFPCALYNGNTAHAYSFLLNSRPENVYRIGTYSNYAELSFPSLYTTTVGYIIYPDLTDIKICVQIYGEEYDITSGFELPMLDAVQALENSQQRTNAVISNVLSLLGQGATSVGAFSTGNYLAGALTVGQIGSNANKLYNFATQRVNGGINAYANSALHNILHGNFNAVRVGKPVSPSVANQIETKGYEMLEEYQSAKVVNGCYFEIIADEIDVPLAYQRDIMERLQNGVYFLLENGEN